MVPELLAPQLHDPADTRPSCSLPSSEVSVSFVFFTESPAGELPFLFLPYVFLDIFSFRIAHIVSPFSPCSSCLLKRDFLRSGRLGGNARPIRAYCCWVMSPSISDKT